MPDISQIQMPSGTVYDIKDATARAQIAGAIVLRGESITALQDWSTTNPINLAELTTAEPSDWSTNYTDYYTYDNTTHTFSNVTGATAPTWVANTYFEAKSFTASRNDAVFYIESELIFDGNAWHKYGDFVGLGNMAKANTASTSYQPSGDVSQPIFTGNSLTLSGSFTPSGSVSAPTISVDTAGSTTTINNPTKKTVVLDIETANPGATAPPNPFTYCTVSNEVLSFNQLGVLKGDSITTSSETVKTGDASYTASQPTFTGTTDTVTVTGTPSGTVSKPTFTGTTTTITVTPDSITS